MKKLLLTTALVFSMNAGAASFGSVYADQYQHGSHTYGAEAGYFNDSFSTYGFTELSSTGTSFSKANILASNFYAQTSYFTAGSFNTAQTVVGTGVSLNSSYGSITPFVGSVVGTKNAMIGWSALSNIGSVTLSHWNEVELKPSTNPTFQGAISAMYSITKHVGTGITYRYYYGTLQPNHFTANFIYRIYYKL